MAATRLSDAQKQELVSRFQSGGSTQELADAYGCSPNTVIRVVKAALGPSGYEELKRQRGRNPGASASATEDPPVALQSAASRQDSMPELDPASPSSESRSEPAPAFSPEAAESAIGDDTRTGAEDDSKEQNDSDAPNPSEAAHEAARALAIDDADDFDELDDDADSEDDADGEDDDQDSGRFEDRFVEVPVSLVDGLDQPLISARPWRGEELPASAYMLVDKTVELQARPLGEIPELGRLADEELGLQALVLYSNPRQAKRQCGRTQRVIKVPDVGVFERTASYLLRQGIRRVVLEGALYALPGA